MDLSRNKTREEKSSPSSQSSAKGRFLAICAVLLIVYIGFSFAFNAYADPPTSPYTPGETLSPTCPPTGPSSTDCTVLPPLFSTTTLPMGGILYMSDTSGTVSAATTTLYWNPSTGEFTIGGSGALGLPTQSATTTLLLLGSNQISGGNPAGTFIGGNVTSGYRGDWMDFELGSSSVFQLDASGSLEIGTGTPANNISLFTVASTSNIFTVLSNGNVGIGTASPTFMLQVGGTAALGSTTITGMVTTTDISITSITNALMVTDPTGNANAYSGSSCAAGSAAISVSATGTVICATQGTLTTSTAGIANFIPLWTGAATLGNSWLQQTANSLIVASGSGILTINATNNSLFQLGSSSIQGGNASGTFFGINASTSFNGDFANFEVNSSTAFKVSSSGAFLFAGNGLVGGKLNVTGTISGAQAYITSSTIANLTFTNATGSGNLQIGTFHTTGAITASTTFEVAGTSTFLGRIEIGTTSFSGTSTALVICPISSQCTVSSTASTTKTVLWVGSTNNFATGTSIVAKGGIWAGQADVGEFIPVVGDDSGYGQGDVVSNVGTSSVLFNKSQSAYDPTVAGVITTTAGLVAGGGVDHGTTVIALAGRVPVNVTMQNGQIHTGDYITSSDIPGVAMRATQPGRVIGMALEDDAGDPNNPTGISQVMILVNPGWSLGSLTDADDIASSSWALENASSGGAFIIDQFTAYVQAALAKLGVAISNGVATLQGIVANTVSTNQLCVQGTCVNGNQLSNLLNNSNNNNSAPPAPAPSSSSTPATPPDDAGSSTPSSTPNPPADTPSSSDPSSTIPAAPPSDSSSSSP